MSKAGDIVLKDLLPLYEKWLNQDGLSIQQVGLIVLGSAIACLQEAEYTASDILREVERVFTIGSGYTNRVSDIFREVERVSTIGSKYQDANRPLKPREVKDVAVSCIRCDKEFMPALFCPSCSGECETDRPLNPQEIKIVTDYVNRNCEHEWSFDKLGTRRCIKCLSTRF